MFREPTVRTAELLDLLPDKDIAMINTIVKKFVLAWDPDYTKVTPKEREILDRSDEELRNDIFVTEDDVWS